MGLGIHFKGPDAAATAICLTLKVKRDITIDGRYDAARTNAFGPPTIKHELQNMGDQQEHSTLLRLPPELREHIYRFLLVKGSPIEPQRRSNREDERTLLPFFRTCKLVHREATKVYFSCNIFRFHDDGGLDTDELPLFFGSLSTTTLRLCSAISLESSLGPPPPPGHDHQCSPNGSRAYCTGSIEINLALSMTATSGQANCCGRPAEQLSRARARVQAALTKSIRAAHEIEFQGEDEAERARLGSEVGIEFCSTFEHLHPDYGD